MGKPATAAAVKEDCRNLRREIGLFFAVMVVLSVDAMTLLHVRCDAG